MQRRHAAALIATLPWALPGLAQAPAWPDKPMRMVVPYPPGASTDALGRLVAQKVGEALGKPFVVDNRAGASGNIGSELVAKSPADGYTFLLGTDATHSANYHLTPNPGFHPIKDFTPLTLATLNPIVLVVNAQQTPATNLRELVDYVKANPGKGSYGSSGSGSPHHLSGELLRQRSGAPLVHVPYRGGGPAVNDLLGGQIPIVFSSLITVLPHIQSGRLRAIAFTQTTRYEGLPNVPTVAETYPGFEMPSWLGFFGPANLPEAITRRMSEEMVKALKDPEVKTKLAAAGLVVLANTPAEYAAQIARDFEQRGKLIREGGIKAD